MTTLAAKVSEVSSADKRIFVDKSIIETRMRKLTDIISSVIRSELPYRQEILSTIIHHSSKELADAIEMYVAEVAPRVLKERARSKDEHKDPMILDVPVSEFLSDKEVSYRSDGSPVARSINMSLIENLRQDPILENLTDSNLREEITRATSINYDNVYNAITKTNKRPTSKKKVKVKNAQQSKRRRNNSGTKR